MKFFSSVKKTFKVNKLAKQMSKPIRSFSDLKNDYSEKAREELFNLILNEDDNLKPIVEEYSINRDVLNKLYTKLIVAGAGQWVRGHFVAVSALVFPNTLEYCVTMNNQENVEWSEVPYK